MNPDTEFKDFKMKDIQSLTELKQLLGKLQTQMKQDLSSKDDQFGVMFKSICVVKEFQKTNDLISTAFKKL